MQMNRCTAQNAGSKKGGNLVSTNTEKQTTKKKGPSQTAPMGFKGKNQAFLDAEYLSARFKKTSIEDVISVGVVITNPEHEELDRFYSTVQLTRGHKLPPLITELTGLTNEELEFAPSYEEVMTELINLVKKWQVGKICVWGGDKNNFQRDFESDREYEELKKSHKVDYPELDRVLEEDDKWTILRRLAQVDPMLNIDRSYASQVLHDIERMIEQESKNGAVEKREAINKITAHYLNPNSNYTIDDDEIDDEEYTIGNMKVNVAIGKAKNELEKIKHMTDTWNAELQQLIPAHDYQSAALRNNKGFHGVDKALRKVEREIEEYAKEGE